MRLVADVEPAAASTGDAPAEIPDETAGPYPGDGSNGPNVLTESGVVRSDITYELRRRLGRRRRACPTTIEMTLLDVAAGGTPLAGAAVYLWHCNIDGQYSMYDRGHRRRELPARRAGERQRRQGHVQEHLPGRLLGPLAAHPLRGLREPRRRHVGGSKLKTSQIALPKDACDLVYATDGYEQSVQNLAQTSLDSDMVFSDGYASQLATTSGASTTASRSG